MSAIIRSIAVLETGEKGFFLTPAELYYLRQENNVLENIFYVTEEFWSQYKNPFGMEQIEDIFIKKADKKPILILLDYKYADKLIRRDVLHSVMPINSIMTNYYKDLKRGKIVADQMIIDEEVFLGKKFVKEIIIEDAHTKATPLDEGTCFKSALPGISRVVTQNDPNFERLFLMEQ
ncbi:MAG: hypothetical protein KBF62_01830 [Candidatus Pacebacteria bacterium]|jgi:hypothetical protein|nr:hypothetical protein [Candidatus Paceibacterota bacterium]MBP9058359.1 hypothetical protein [Candidatus Paceibacterota bacterium]MBP9770083.1 hypothetical protein [Candidatus Paceibacterota bacterium]